MYLNLSIINVMKLAKTTYLFCIVLLMSIGIQAQNSQLSRKQIEREKNKVEIFTPEERDNIQRWFYEQTNSMKLTEEVRSEYSGTLVYYTYDMRRLNDKDQNRTHEEVLADFVKLYDRANEAVRPLLTDEQYKLHLEYFTKVARDAIERFNKKD